MLKFAPLFFFLLSHTHSFIPFLLLLVIFRFLLLRYSGYSFRWQKKNESKREEANLAQLSKMKCKNWHERRFNSRRVGNVWGKERDRPPNKTNDTKKKNSLMINKSMISEAVMWFDTILCSEFICICGSYGYGKCGKAEKLLELSVYDVCNCTMWKFSLKI